MKRPDRVSAALLSPAIQLAESLVLVLVPHGGQRTARRNAWSQVVADKHTAADRDEAHRYLHRPLRLVGRTGS